MDCHGNKLPRNDKMNKKNPQQNRGLLLLVHRKEGKVRKNVGVCKINLCKYILYIYYKFPELILK